MKKLFFLLTIVSFLIVSCEKDEASLLSNGDLIKPSIASTGMYNVGMDELGWLVFEDGNHIKQVFEDLESSNEAYMDSFDECLSVIEDDMSDEEIDSIYHICGYTENFEVVSFENSFEGFTSLREDLVEQQDIWLESNSSDLELDFSNYPDHYCDGTYLGALINSFGEFQVGDLVYFYKDDGRAIAVNRDELDDSNIDAFRDIFYSEEFDINEYEQETITDEALINNFYYGMDESPSKSLNSKGGGVIIVGVTVGAIVVKVVADIVKWLDDLNDPGDCSFDDNESGSFSVGSNELFQCKSKWKAVLVFGQYSHAWIRHYKKVGSKWKRRSTKMGFYMVTPYLMDDNICSGYNWFHKYPANGSAYLKDKKDFGKNKGVGDYHKVKIANDLRYVYFYDDTTIKLTLRNTW